MIQVPWGPTLGSMLVSSCHAWEHHGKGRGSMLGSILVSCFQGMGEVTRRKVPWGPMLGSMLGSMFVFCFQGMGEVTIREVP